MQQSRWRVWLSVLRSEAVPAAEEQLVVLEILTEQTQRLIEDFVALLPQLAIASMILAVTWAAAELVRRPIDRAGSRLGLRRRLTALFTSASRVMIWIFGALIAAAVVLPGMNGGSLVAALGLGSILLTIIFHGILENSIAGILIMLRKKPRIGDVLRCGASEGRLERVTLRETHLRSLSSELTILPNSHLLNKPVSIVTEAAKRRYEIVVGVAFATDLDEAAEVIRRAVRSVEEVAPDQPVDVFAREFGRSAIDFTVRWWSASAPVSLHRTRSNVIRAIRKAFDRAEIEIPFPQLAISIKEG